MKKFVSAILTGALLFWLAVFSVSAENGLSSRMKDSILKSALLQSQDFYKELPTRLDSAVAYCSVFIDSNMLFSLSSLNDIQEEYKEWYVDIDKYVEITLVENNSGFEVMESTLPPEIGDKPATVRLDPSETTAILEKYSSANGYNSTVVSVYSFGNARFLLIEGKDKIEIALLFGREDFCNMKLGEVIPLDEAITRLKKSYPESTNQNNGKIEYIGESPAINDYKPIHYYGGIYGEPTQNTELNDQQTQSSQINTIPIVMISAFFIMVIIATVIMITKKRKN